MNFTTSNLLVEPISIQPYIAASSNFPSDDFLKITNSKIIEFYRCNPNISFEVVNLLVLEILQTGAIQQSNGEISIRSDPIVSAFHEKHRIDELTTFLTSLREVINQQIQHISSDYIIAKTEYVQELRAILFRNDGNAKQRIQENNGRFIERIKFAISGLRVTSIADKTQLMIRQFQKILTANSESIFNSDEICSKEKEYVTNFESNTTHMIQAIIQLLSDCLAEKERQLESLIASLKRREDVNSAAYYKLIYECNDLLHQLHTKSDNTFDRVISNTFPTASITNESVANGPDKYVVLRDDKPTIRIESHNIKNRNVGLSEIKSFLKERISHGIMISQHTGITTKPNYHIEIHNHFVTVYIHQLEHSAEKLQIAVEMIDVLSAKMGDFCVATENKYSIPKEVLDDVNREYQQFIIQKEAIMSMVKEQHKRLLGQLDDIRFNSLDKYLATRYSSCKKQGYTCDLCNIFNVGTLKGLAAHKRGCARKIGTSILPIKSEDILLKKLLIE